jgi:sporulation protein YlmC with PRC-barrel domain
MSHEPRMSWSRDKNQPGKLVRLGDSDLTLAEPSDDLRGRKVLDVNGDEVGTVEGLFIDEDERRVRLLQVGSGGFFGLGEKKQLIPVDAITWLSEEEVQIAQDLTHLAGAPLYDPEVVPARTFYQDLYDYYDVAPYWAPGYVYPRFPL